MQIYTIKFNRRGEYFNRIRCGCFGWEPEDWHYKIWKFGEPMPDLLEARGVKLVWNTIDELKSMQQDLANKLGITLR